MRRLALVGQVPDLPVLKSVGQVPDLPILKFLTRTRPTPFLRSLYQPRPHGISFNIPDDMLKLPVIADPVIVGFILPERLPSPTHNGVGKPGTRAFYGSGYFSQGLVRHQKSMDVVRHYDPGEKVAQLPLLFGREERVNHACSDSWDRQPSRPRARSVELPVEQCETFAFGGRISLRKHVIGARHGAVQSPGQKDRNAFGLPMRQFTTIEADDKAVVTRIDNSHCGRSEAWPTPGRSETWPTPGRSETWPTPGRSETWPAPGRSETCPTL
jgi:hypothetical protein